MNLREATWRIGRNAFVDEYVNGRQLLFLGAWTGFSFGVDFGIYVCCFLSNYAWTRHLLSANESCRRRLACLACCIPWTSWKCATRSREDEDRVGDNTRPAEIIQKMTSQMIWHVSLRDRPIMSLNGKEGIACQDRRVCSVKWKHHAALPWSVHLPVRFLLRSIVLLCHPNVANEVYHPTETFFVLTPAWSSKGKICCTLEYTRVLAASYVRKQRSRDTVQPSKTFRSRKLQKQFGSCETTLSSRCKFATIWASNGMVWY